MRLHRVALLAALVLFLSVVLASPVGAWERIRFEFSGKITEASGEAAEGTWKFEARFDFRDPAPGRSPNGWGRWTLDMKVREPARGIVRRFETIGSRTGVCGGEHVFTHVADMVETTGREERRVFVFAMGDEHRFECAVLPMTEANWALFLHALRAHFTEVPGLVREAIATSDDVIRGVTRNFRERTY